MEEFEKAVKAFFKLHNVTDPAGEAQLRDDFLNKGYFGDTLEEKTAAILETVKDWENAKEVESFTLFKLWVKGEIPSPSIIPEPMYKDTGWHF